ncbi:unnamed protein product [Polarella glacialis]|uniref:Uncharacterized protein n=1 Tax=Polarella glacialis TaxID=89957 RepID=A0A813G1H1_POLGL|nr:unnamed protein product [Polarella glacialis]
MPGEAELKATPEQQPEPESSADTQPETQAEVVVQTAPLIDAPPEAPPRQPDEKPEGQDGEMPGEAELKATPEQQQETILSQAELPVDTQPVAHAEAEVVMQTAPLSKSESAAPQGPQDESHLGEQGEMPSEVEVRAKSEGQANNNIKLPVEILPEAVTEIQQESQPDGECRSCHHGCLGPCRLRAARQARLVKAAMDTDFGQTDYATRGLQNKPSSEAATTDRVSVRTQAWVSRVQRMLSDESAGVPGRVAGRPSARGLSRALGLPDFSRRSFVSTWSAEIGSGENTPGWQDRPWTPPSPPAPSTDRSFRSEATNAHRRAQGMGYPTAPACGLRPGTACLSARTAAAARLQQAAVPGLDLSKVNMGEEDEDDESDSNETGHVALYDSMSMGSFGDVNGSEAKTGVSSAFVPLLNMATLHSESTLEQGMDNLSSSRLTQKPEVDSVRGSSRREALQVPRPDGRLGGGSPPGQGWSHAGSKDRPPCRAAEASSDSSGVGKLDFGEGGPTLHRADSAPTGLKAVRSGPKKLDASSDSFPQREVPGLRPGVGGADAERSVEDPLKIMLAKVAKSKATKSKPVPGMSKSKSEACYLPQLWPPDLRLPKLGAGKRGAGGGSRSAAAIGHARGAGAAGGKAAITNGVARKMAKPGIVTNHHAHFHFHHHVFPESPAHETGATNS